MCALVLSQQIWNYDCGWKRCSLAVIKFNIYLYEHLLRPVLDIILISNQVLDQTLTGRKTPTCSWPDTEWLDLNTVWEWPTIRGLSMCQSLQKKQSTRDENVSGAWWKRRGARDENVAGGPSHVARSRRYIIRARASSRTGSSVASVFSRFADGVIVGFVLDLATLLFLSHARKGEERRAS